MAPLMPREIEQRDPPLLNLVTKPRVGRRDARTEQVSAHAEQLVHDAETCVIHGHTVVSTRACRCC